MDRDLESARRRLAKLAAAVGHEPDDDPDSAGHDLLTARRRLAKLAAAVSGGQGRGKNG